MFSFMGECYGEVIRKNLNAAKPPEQSKGLGGIKTLAVRTKTLHGIKRVPQCYHIGSIVVVSHIQLIDYQPKNYFSRWPITLVVC